MNKIILAGRLAQEPRMKEGNNGSYLLANISIAVNDSFNYKQTYFLNCVAWSKTAEFIQNYLHKGDLVTIEGRIGNRSYLDNEGKKIYTTDLTVDSIRSFGGRKNTVTENNSYKTEEFVSPKKEEIDEKKEEVLVDWEDDLN